MRLMILAAALLAGCAEKAVDMRLTVGETASDLDVSCVDTMYVIVEDASGSYTEDCLPISGATSVDDVIRQVKGKFTRSMPDDLLAVEMLGLSGGTPDVCGTGAVVFYGAQAWSGTETMEMKIEGTMSCSAMTSTSTIQVRPIDFMALVDTPATATAPTCRSPVGMVDVALGTIRPTGLDLPNYWTSRMEFDVYAQVNTETGLAELPAWGEPLANSCLAVASDELWSSGCIYPAMTTMPCAAPGEVVIPMLADTAAFESVDNAIFADFHVMVLGMVWDSTTKKPVAGATVSIDPARGQIVYANRGSGNRFDPTQGTTTTASGLFVAYMNEPSVLTVTGALPGGNAATKKMRVGGETDLANAVIVPLR